MVVVAGREDLITDGEGSTRGNEPIRAEVTGRGEAVAGAAIEVVDVLAAAGDHDAVRAAGSGRAPVVDEPLPPAGDDRLIRATTRPVSEQYDWVLGRPEQVEPLYQRLRDFGVTEPTEADAAVERITGVPSPARERSYRERRKELMLAMLDEHADALDAAVDELGRWVDHVRQVGIRGFVAERTNGPDFVRPGSGADETAPSATADSAAPGDTGTSRRDRYKKVAGQRKRKGGRSR